MSIKTEFENNCLGFEIKNKIKRVERVTDIPHSLYLTVPKDIRKSKKFHNWIQDKKLFLYRSGTGLNVKYEILYPKT